MVQLFPYIGTFGKWCHQLGGSVKPCIHSSLQVFTTEKNLSPQPRFEPREEVVIGGCEVWAVRRMLKSDTAKIGEERHFSRYVPVHYCVG